MQGKPTPSTILVAAAVAALLLAVASTLLAVGQPWLGLRLQAPIASTAGVRAVWVDPAGPTAAVPPGALIVAVSDGTGRAVDLVPFDVVEEPDTVSTYAAFDGFFARQGEIAEILRSRSVVLTLSQGEQIVVAPASTRPLYSLPLEFWVQMSIGLIGVVIGAWALGLRFEEPGARLLALNTGALLLSTYPSGIYMTRELALPQPLFGILSSFNFLGSMSFSAALLGLFLIYPRRVLRGRLAYLPVLLVVAVGFADAFRLFFAGPGEGRYLPITLVVTASLVAAAVQYRVTRDDPRLRAAVLWFALAVAAAFGLFVLLYAMPSIAGRGGDLPQSFAYLLALPVFAGVAIGVARYRLFELEAWSFRILFYLVGAVLLVGLDLLLITVVALDRLPAFGLSLGIVALLYLPLREAIGRRLAPSEVDRGRLFQRTIDAALAPSPAARNEQWRLLLSDAFKPLQVGGGPTAGVAASVAEDGLSLIVAGTGDVAPVRLGYANGGRRLFARRDAELADDLRAMLTHTIESRDAYEKGAAAERARIARDMHDNVGAKLLSALHSTEPPRKDAMVRETLTDLRNIVNNLTGSGESFDDVLAELRLETAERLSAAGLDLDWHADDWGGRNVAPGVTHSLRSIVREAVSNTIRHAEARQVAIRIRRRGDRLALTVADDGKGLAAEIAAGNGLTNIRSRVEAMDGILEIAGSGPGTRLAAEFRLRAGVDA